MDGGRSNRPLHKASASRCETTSTSSANTETDSSVNGVGQTSILKLQINDIRPERAIEFLDALSNRYIEYSTAAREEVNRKTDEFIETQLIQIEANIDSLQGIIDEQRRKPEAWT